MAPLINWSEGLDIVPSGTNLCLWCLKRFSTCLFYVFQVPPEVPNAPIPDFIWVGGMSLVILLQI